jgi:hypothetical protein
LTLGTAKAEEPNDEDQLDQVYDAEIEIGEGETAAAMIHSPLARTSSLR